MLPSFFERVPRAARRAAAALWALSILALSLLPSNFFPQTDEIVRFPQADKAVHLVLYSVLTALLLWTAVVPGQPLRLRRFGFLAAAATAYGLLLEWLQHFTDTRSMDLLDGLANAAGAFLVAGVGWWLTRKRKA